MGLRKNEDDPEKNPTDTHECEPGLSLGDSLKPGRLGQGKCKETRGARLLVPTLSP
jgi:hypothetical protein